MRITLTLDFEPHPEVPIQAQMHNALLQWMAADVADGCRIFSARQQWGSHGSKATTETQVSAEVESAIAAMDRATETYAPDADRLKAVTLAAAALSSVNFSKGT